MSQTPLEGLDALHLHPPTHPVVSCESSNTVVTLPAKIKCMLQEIICRAAQIYNVICRYVTPRPPVSGQKASLLYNSKAGPLSWIEDKRKNKDRSESCIVNSYLHPPPLIEPWHYHQNNKVSIRMSTCCFFATLPPASFIQPHDIQHNPAESGANLVPWDINFGYKTAAVACMTCNESY